MHAAHIVQALLMIHFTQRDHLIFRLHGAMRSQTVEGGGVKEIARLPSHTHYRSAARNHIFGPNMKTRNNIFQT
jgi:hypothetical protein